MLCLHKELFNSVVQDTIHALVLSIIKYGETSLITNCFTLEYGLQSYMLKGILSKGKKPLSKSLFEPLALLELKAPKNKEGKIGYIKEAKLLYPYSTIPFDLRKKALVFFLAEVLQQVGREEQEPNPALFNFLKKSILWLDQHSEIGLFHIKMMLDLTQFIGFYPNLTPATAPYFDLESGCMSYEKNQPNTVEDPIKSFWIQLLGTNFDEFSGIKILKEHKSSFLKSVVTYYQLHLQQFKPPKSTDVLNEIFKTS
jgi:DNA repair protein RecO (recombination protein O)